jgi:hypothetical protein
MMARLLRITIPNRSLTVAALLCAASIILALRGAAQEPKNSSAPVTELKIVERVTTATDKALDYLEQKQSKAGESAGSWSSNMAMNGVAVLAFLSKGHVPGRGKYGDVVEGGTVKPGVLTRAKKYILSRANKQTGYISSSSMYEHGLVTTSLAEMYGMDPDPELEETLRKAIDLIVKCQSPAGGWRYSPAPVDQDLSVSVMQIVALRAANNAEIPVPQQTLDKAIKYVQSMANGNVGFGYAGPGAGPQTTPAGILSLQLLGKYDDPRIPGSLDYLTSLAVGWPGGAQYFYYSHYYAIQATYQAGGKHWNDWHPKVRELLLSKQNADGSWDVPPGTAEANLITSDNKTYSTALATLILNIYMHYLPAYQR